MFVPKPKVIIKPMQKQDFFLASGEAVPFDKIIWYSGRYFQHTVQFRNAEFGAVRRHFQNVEGDLIIRRRIYIQFELRESVRIEGKNKSKSRNLKGVTIRQGKLDVPKDFFKKVNEKLETFGLSRAEHKAIVDQVRTHLERIIAEHSG